MAFMLSSLPFSLGRLLGRKLPKDILTTKLEEAAKGDICPICAMEGYARYIWLWSFLWESVNDPDTREEFIKGGGLCRADNWSMVEVAQTRIKSSLGVAIVYEHLAKVIGRAMRQGARTTEPWIDIGHGTFSIGQKCQACTTGKEAEDRSVRRLALATTVNHPPDWLGGAFPVCYNHIRQLLRRAPRPEAKSTIAPLQKSRMQELEAAVRTPEIGSKRRHSRLEASLFHRGTQFAIPERSDRLYKGAAERCPICREVGEREQELLEEVYRLDEGQTSPPLCLGHYAALSRKCKGSGEALRSTRLKEELHLLEAYASSPGAESGAGYIDTQGDAPACAICRSRDEAEGEVLRSRLPEWTGPQGPKDLLCLHHLGRGLTLASGKDKERLLSDQRDKLAGLMRELSEFIAMHDYRSPRRPPEDPDSPYRWALRFLTSEPAVIAPFLGVGGADRFNPSRTSSRSS